MLKWKRTKKFWLQEGTQWHFHPDREASRRDEKKSLFCSCNISTIFDSSLNYEYVCINIWNISYTCRLHLCSKLEWLASHPSPFEINPQSISLLSNIYLISMHQMCLTVPFSGRNGVTELLFYPDCQILLLKQLLHPNTQNYVVKYRNYCIKSRPLIQVDLH